MLRKKGPNHLSGYISYKERAIYFFSSNKSTKSLTDFGIVDLTYLIRKLYFERFILGKVLLIRILATKPNC